MIENFHTGLHTGGVNQRFLIHKNKPEQLMFALDLLTTCHPHVFVVDQSSPTVTVIGVSDSGYLCLKAEFKKFFELEQELEGESRSE